MIRFAPYAPGDVARIEQAGEGKIPSSVDALALGSWAFTARLGDRVIGAGGILRLDAWRGIAWALFAPGLPVSAWTRLVRRCRGVLKLAEMDGIHCIEAEVALRFMPGHRFARMLGFRFVGVLPGRAADGGLFVRYARTTAAAEQPTTRVQALLALTEETLAHSLLRSAA